MRFSAYLLVSGVFCSLLAFNPTHSHAAPVKKIVPTGKVSFTSKSQNFSVWFPTKPTENQFSQTKSGKKMNVFIFQADKDEVSYLIVSVSTKGVPKAVRGTLDDGQKGLIRSSGATLQKREDIQLNGVQGRELTLKSFIGRPIRLRMYQTPEYFYQIVAQGEKAPMQKQDAQVTRFLNSFRLLP